MTGKTLITYDREPAHYRHWSLAVDGAVATLALEVDEEGGLRPGYRLKRNSYDLGVDIELNDALNRLRFEHPQVRAVIVTSALDRMFCAGANIYMLAGSSHAAKVNFCRFTNETRNSMEDASRRSGIAFLAACNGAAAGGGYELALACDEIWLVDDRSSAVSLPEVPLLGVLPGTGGLTRITDKRRVRRDLADVFCTGPDGARGRRALAWGLVDRIAPPQRFEAAVRARAEELAGRPGLPAGGPVPLSPAGTAHRARRLPLPECAGADRRGAPARGNHRLRPLRPGRGRALRPLVAARRRTRARGCGADAAHQS